MSAAIEEGRGSDVAPAWETLASVPALGALYRSALSRASRAVLAAPSRASTLPGVGYRVEGVRADLGQLAAYQRLLTEPGTDSLPSGLVHVLAFPLAMRVMTRPDFPLPVLGMVHLANTVEHRRPVPASEALDVEAWAQDLRAHRKGTQVDLVCRARGAGGEVVWRGVSTYLAKGRPLPGLAPAPEAPPAEPGTAAIQAAPVPTAQWRLGADAARRYAEISGDRNPIHTSRLAARAFGFQRPIAHGMHTAALALALVGPARGRAYDWSVEFASPVLLPARVAVQVRSAEGGGHDVRAWNPRRDRWHLQLSVRPRT